jgi:hypothetical protein
MHRHNWGSCQAWVVTGHALRKGTGPARLPSHLSRAAGDAGSEVRRRLDGQGVGGACGQAGGVAQGRAHTAAASRHQHTTRSNPEMLRSWGQCTRPLGSLWIAFHEEPGLALAWPDPLSLPLRQSRHAGFHAAAACGLHTRAVRPQQQPLQRAAARGVLLRAAARRHLADEHLRVRGGAHQPPRLARGAAPPGRGGVTRLQQQVRGVRNWAKEALQRRATGAGTSSSDTSMWHGRQVRVCTLACVDTPRTSASSRAAARQAALTTPLN